MKYAVAIAFALLITTTVGLPAKGVTTKIRISGSTLAKPVEITDPQVLRDFAVWDWAQPGHDGFVVSYVNTSLPAPPREWPRYEVSFYSGSEQPVYVVTYQFNPKVAQGYIYVPATRLNRTTIERSGMEDWWLPASAAWERIARPLLRNVGSVL